MNARRSAALARRTSLAAAVAVLAVLAPPAAAADPYVVVANPDVKVERLRRGELSRLFLKKSTRWPDGRVVKVVEPSDEKLRGAFAERVHGKSLGAVRAYWNQLVFSGREIPPVEKTGDAALLEWVKATPGAIGYVSAGADTAGVRALAVSGE